MLPESTTTKPPEAPGTQCHATGLVIQELLKSVKGFQASLEILNAKVEGNGNCAFIHILLRLYVPVTRSNYRFAAGN